MPAQKKESREQLHRIFSVIRVLINHRNPVSSQQIVDELEQNHGISTTLRTVQRDLVTLESLGYNVKIEGAQGYLLNRSELASMIFTDAEVQALQMSRSIFGYFEGTYIKKQVDSAISMITGSTDRNLTKKYLAELEESFMVHLGPHREFTGKNDIIDELFEAINGRYKVVIDYHRPGMKTVPLKVDPYRIILYCDTLYLLARRADADSLQVFHISRIESIRTLGQKFRRNSAILDKFEDRLWDCFGIFAYGKLTDVTIRFSKSVLDALRERVWHHSQQITEENDCVTLKLRVLASNEFASWILGWGKEVLEIKPKAVSDMVAKMRG